MISAKIIADSKAENGTRLTTFELEYPRFIHCFDDETEVLVLDSHTGCKKFTPFRRLNDFPNRYKVAQVEPETHKISFGDYEYIEQDFEGELVDFKNQRLNFSVTDEHRMYVGSRKSKGVWSKEIIPAKDLLCEHTAKRFYKSGYQDGKDSISPFKAKLCAFFVSDGHLPKKGHQAIFRFSKNRKVVEVCRILSALGLEHDVRKYGDGTTNIVFQRMNWMEDTYTLEGMRQLPAWAFDLTGEAFSFFRDGLLESDGCVANREYNSYSEQLIDDIQVVFHLNGCSFNKRKYGDCFKVKFLKEDSPVLRRDKHKVSLRKYKGKVYCVSVDTGLIMVRRHGCVHISGNCEFMTHRMLSRNAASSRAIPLKNMLKLIRSEPAMPVEWGRNQAGMQAKEMLDPSEELAAKFVWRLSGVVASGFAWMLGKIGVHKQIANRVVEPWSHIKVVATATDWDNFFHLRCHKDAQPEIHKLADLMWEAYEKSNPEELAVGEWHTPYVFHTRDTDDAIKYFVLGEGDLPIYISQDEALKVSASCCAQVSYRRLDQSVKKAKKIYERLVESTPIHASPFEHQGTPLEFNITESGNFRGWKQHRFMIDGHVCRDFVPHDTKEEDIEDLTPTDEETGSYNEVT